MARRDTKNLITMDVAKLFEDLDNTNNEQVIEESKRKLAEVFNSTKDAWLVNGLIDYYNHTSSEWVLDVLSKVSQPHDRSIFDRLFDLMREKDSRGVSNNKQTALTIFGYIVRANPTWLHKVTSHNLLKEIFKLLKNDNDVVIYLSALWSIIALLPIVPSSVAQYLSELFDVFGHLAAWKDSQVLNEVEHLHLQIGLIFLFIRLYGMYPCNFMDYIRQTYIYKDKQSIFQHTIKGLLDTVKVHPLLATATKETEISSARWKKMEPHDVVYECARLSLETNERRQDIVNECTTRNMEPVSEPISNTTVKLSDLNCLPNKTVISFQSDIKFDSIWSPSNVVHATPPPTGALSSHTSTPTPNLHNYGMQLLDGSSPPEAAVEATPETTPMKDNIKSVHSLPANSTIARAFWNTSQPSSPLKKDVSPFRFTSDQQHQQLEPNPASTQRLWKMIDDRSQAQMQLKLQKPAVVASPPTVNNDEDKEDQEVRVINSRPVNVPTKLNTDDTLTNTIDFENEGSPCSSGGLHIPYSRSVIELQRKVNRLRLVSNCLEDASFSAGTSPDAHGNIMVTRGNEQIRIRRFNSWPRFSSADAKPLYDSKRDTNKSSPNKKNKVDKSTTHSKKYYQELRDDVSSKYSAAFGPKDAQVQTLKTIFDQPYDKLMTSIINDEIKSRKLNSMQENLKANVKPYEYVLLDKVIEIAGTRNGGSGVVKTIDDYKESLQLMHLQLQYERHRREVHAERNRRLLGMSRKIHQYEQNQETLTEQAKILTSDLEKVNNQLTDLRYKFNTREQDMLKETEGWRTKYMLENDENKRLRALVEQLQTQVQEYSREKRENHIELETARGELFDLKNELRQMMIQAELANRYKDELTHLQSEVILMGEVQLKCKEKFSSIGLLEAKDCKIELLQESYMEEINNLKATLESKTSQLETARIKVSDLESQLTRRDVISTDLKRDLKRTKEEYQEKINALEKKYTAQKAIMLRMDEHILELYKNRSPVNVSALSPDSERDIAGSLEHASSPLSLSQTSSDGLSASFSKSVTEIRNLQALVQQSLSSGGNNESEHSTKTNPADIPSSTRSSSNN